MARISDSIEIFLKNLIDNEIANEVLIQRNQLADQFRCAPSQINYVLTTRFTYEKGYLIESKRGGGGCIFIKKLQYNELKKDKLKLIYNAIGSSITYRKALDLIENICENKLITEREKEIIKISISDRSLGRVEQKNEVRADILKGIIATVSI